MIPLLRKKYNESFTADKYAAYIEGLQNLFPGTLDFRVAETPLFVPHSFIQKMETACEAIIDVIIKPEYLEQSKNAIPEHLRVPNEDAHPHCIAFDFGVCTNAAGELEPQLIEMQGFPSLFAWEVLVPEVHAGYFGNTPGYSVYLNGLDRDGYISLMKKIIIAEEKPEQVILLEISPHLQKTRVDFAATEQLLGISTVDLMDLELEGKEIFYRKEGRKIKVKRIYNRVIFDDLFQQPAAIQDKGRLFQQELDVTWVPHPNWFYRISKYTLPFISNPYVPETHFLDEAELPSQLSEYVVKPLFSFAGQGVIIDVTAEDIAAIKDPHNWIIQRKVKYAEAIATPGEPAKAEIRLFYFWEEGKGRPVPANNLARLSKGKMIGVRYNKDKEWVGGTFCLFENK